MNFHISRLRIQNFRNFADMDVRLAEKSVIVGENRAGKTNLLHALRLALDPALPDSERMLREDDFWDGVESPMEDGVEILVSIEFKGFEDNKAILAILSDCLIKSGEMPTARISYIFAPRDKLHDEDAQEGITAYEFRVFGGIDKTNEFGYQKRKFIPIMVLHALRDAEHDLSRWRKSPIRPLIDRLNVSKDLLSAAVEKMDEATKEVMKIDSIRELSNEIEDRVNQIIGDSHPIEPTLGIASTDAFRLLRSMGVFLDGERKRTIGEASLGIANVLYLSLLLLELEQKEESTERASTILAIEEPEAHLHPHLQRLVYRDFLKRDSTVILTTHSPHIASVSPIKSLVVLRNEGAEKGSKAYSTSQLKITDSQVFDLQRYLDATRAEMLFARGILLVEGDSELYLVPAIAQSLGHTLDQLGITVSSVHGVDFLPYSLLLDEGSLCIPHCIITDGDPYSKEDTARYGGFDRTIKIVTTKTPELGKEMRDLYDQDSFDDLRIRLGNHNYFVGSHTLEIDLVSHGCADAMIETLGELGASKTRIENFRQASDFSDGQIEEKTKTLLTNIEHFGKGRFAQRLASKIESHHAPSYIASASEAIIGTVS